MSCRNTTNSVNDALRRAVRVQTECGSNRTGAIATVAAWLGVSPQIIKMRINDEIVGQPRSKGLIAARCWEFLAMVAQRERAWAENLAIEVEQNKLRLQLNLPLEGTVNGTIQSIRSADEHRLDPSKGQLEGARRKLAEFETIKRAAQP